MAWNSLFGAGALLVAVVLSFVILKSNKDGKDRSLTVLRLLLFIGLALLVNHWLVYAAAIIMSFPTITAYFLYYAILSPFFFISRLINREWEQRSRESFVHSIGALKEELLIKEQAKELY